MHSYLEQAFCRFTIFNNVINHVMGKRLGPFDASTLWIIEEVFNQVSSGAMHDFCSFIWRNAWIGYDLLEIIFQVIKVCLLFIFLYKKAFYPLCHKHALFSFVKDGISPAI